MSGLPQSASRIRLCRVVTVPLFFRTLLHRQLIDVAAAGIDLTLVASSGPEWEEIRRTIPARVRVLEIAREPSPVRDAVSLAAMTAYLAREPFDIVHSTGPKAGLLAALAGFTSRVPVRLHTYTGQPWVELRGAKRWVAREGDRVTGALTTASYADSASQRDFLIEQGIVPQSKIRVLGAGSIAGVDLQRYDVQESADVRRSVRAGLGIPQDAVVIVFLGRVTRDKGIAELVNAFRSLRQRHSNLHLLLVGPMDTRAGPLPSDVLATIENDASVHAVGFQGEPQVYLAASDIFCLPSYREGFGTSAVEAAAMSLPVVASRVSGLSDAVVDGETGVLIPPKDIPATAAALERLIDKPDERVRLGTAGLARVRSHFDARVSNRLVIEEYVRLHEATAKRRAQ